MIVPDEQLHFYRLCGTSMYSNVLGTGTLCTVLVDIYYTLSTTQIYIKEMNFESVLGAAQRTLSF
jgi:hypothetical protein